MDKIKFYSLDISQELPLEFTGKIIADFTTYDVNDKRLDKRYHSVKIFEVIDENKETYFIVYLQYITSWKNELDFYDYYDFDTKDEIGNYLNFYDPLKHVIGYPSGAQFIDKQRNLLDSIEQAYKRLVPIILKEIGYKRKPGRPRKALANTRQNLTLTINRNLRDQAKEANINLSEFLDTALRDHLAKLP